MEMLYHINRLCPSAGQMGGCGFSIQLYPAWKKAAALSGLDQQKVNTAIQNMGRMWLDGCGYGNMYDPDKSVMDEWEERNTGKTPKLGPNARKLYSPREIRIDWGEWGPEHITVPGDACGLDITGGLGAPRDGKTLQTHNVDNFSQVVLLIVVFTWVADFLVAAAEQKERGK